MTARRFELHRPRQDGDTLVAEGVEWTDGTAAVRWVGMNPSTVTWPVGPGREPPEHEHVRRSNVEWLDPEPDERGGVG